jgi:hypothetical protein
MDFVPLPCVGLSLWRNHHPGVSSAVEKSLAVMLPAIKISGA